MSFDGLSQVVYFQKNIISGAKPQGDEGFASLKKLNVDTIVCVDGVIPDVQRATSHGMKTIHIPLKYNSPSDEQKFDLATVVSRALPHGTVYVHCHQGKHRSATASAIASIALGLLSIEEAKERMHVSETSLQYKGLWDSVEGMKKIDSSEIQRNKKTYPSMVQPEGMIDAMITLDEALENLQQLHSNNWKQLESDSEPVGVAEAGEIVDLYRNLQLNQELDELYTDIETHFVNAIHNASELEEALLQKRPVTELHVHLNRMQQSCTNCHEVFRK